MNESYNSSNNSCHAQNRMFFYIDKNDVSNRKLEKNHCDIKSLVFIVAILILCSHYYVFLNSKW